MTITIQARRQEFPEGGSSTRVASRAPREARCCLGAAQGPQKLWGIWSKVLKSSNFQALHSNFRKVLFFKTDYMIFTKFYTNLGINFKKRTSTLIVLICFQGGVRPNPSNPPGYGCAINNEFHSFSALCISTSKNQTTLCTHRIQVVIYILFTNCWKILLICADSEQPVD